MAKPERHAKIFLRLVLFVLVLAFRFPECASAQFRFAVQRAGSAVFGVCLAATNFAAARRKDEMTNMAEDLTALDELRRSGSLTELEFEQAKAKLLGEPRKISSTSQEHTSVSEERLRRVEIENQLLRAERDWNNTRERLMIRNKNGYKSPPNAIIGVLGGVFISMFGIFFADFLRTPLIAVLFVIAGVACTIDMCRKAQAYTEAESVYRAEKDRLNNELRKIRYEPDR